MKVSAYPPLLAADIAAGDLFLVVDVSANATKVITKAQLVTAVGGGGGGSGDMTQLVYDTDGDGVINLTSIPALPESRVTNLVSDLSAKAPLANPVLTGTPTVPTAAPGTNTTQAASTAFVTAAVAAGGMAIGGAVTGGTATYLLYVGAGGVLAQKSTLAFNDTTDTLTVGKIGIGVTPAAPLDVTGGARFRGTWTNVGDGVFVTGIGAGTITSITGGASYNSLTLTASNFIFSISGTSALTIGSNNAITASGPLIVAPYTFATVPAASSYTGATIRITDRSGKYAYSDGTNWRFFADDAVIS